MAQTKLNILPVPTFASLGVNFIQHDIEEYETDSIAVPDGERQTVVQYIDSNSSTQVSVEENAQLKLIMIFDKGSGTVSKLHAELADNAHLELVQLYLGGDTASEIVTVLKGRKAGFTADLGYDLGGSDKLDINLIAEHQGRKSTSQIAVSGVLRDSAVKTFKGTIDFKKGAVGAQGNEKEEVMLLSEKVVNKTVPVILCEEEDVVGNHGATIGRIDERHVFYMKSRGIPEEKIYEIMSRAKLAQVIAHIDDGQAKKRIYGALGWGEEIE